MPPGRQDAQAAAADDAAAGAGAGQDDVLAAAQDGVRSTPRPSLMVATAPLEITVEIALLPPGTTLIVPPARSVSPLATAPDDTMSVPPLPMVVL